MTARTTGRRGKTRADVEIDDGAPVASRRGGDGFLDFLADEVFAERGQKVAGSSGETQQRRIALLETNGVAQNVTPQTGAGRQNDGVLHAGFEIGDRVSGRMRRVEILDRHELEENVVIGDQTQQLVTRVFRRR